MNTRVLLPTIFALAACKDSPSRLGSSHAPDPAPAVAPAPAAPSEPATAPANVTATELARSANRFAFDLWAHVPAGNVAVSPASIAIPMTILWGGAKGATAAQVQSLLHLDGAADVVLSRWGLLAKSLPVKLATRLYAEKTYDVDTTYFTIVRHAFDVWIEPVDFINTADEVRLKINTWIADQTNQKIKDLIPPHGVNAASKLVLVNAIYFLADWAEPFDPANTAPRDFHTSATTKKQVPTMQQTTSYALAHGEGATMIELPYKDGNSSLYLVVPDARDGLAAVEQKLESTLETLQPQLSRQLVQLSLPRLTVDGPQLQLDPVLQALGIKDAFDPRVADFSGMAHAKTDSDKLFVSSVIHRAFVKLDEKGTEAAAATAIVAEGGGMPAKPVEVHADHPFLFLIVDKRSGLLLFMGRVVDPS